ncbi:DUF397 domain-containing protein [Kitasatospora sp. NPDC085464]|uniref:DUF397 domain-containing protein n=1 Tax=Kitasatospora sp. NPDC085464 TaxID=3364063 RepID=UPI0037C6BB85
MAGRGTRHGPLISADFPGAVPVRDSKDPEGPALVFPADAWRSFVAATAAVEFGGVRPSSRSAA